MSLWRSLLAICLTMALTVAGQTQPPAERTWQDADSPHPLWKVAGGDTRSQIDNHRAVLGTARDGQWIEEAAISGGNGTHLYFARQIPKCGLRPDLAATLFVRADRPGVQLLARVVFPHERDPKSGQPLAALIRGSSSTKAGQWEQLRLEQIPLLTERQARVLRLQFGKDLNLEDPYLDLMILNAYTGAGNSALAWDDLRIENVPIVDGNVVQAAFEDANQVMPTRPGVALQGNILTVGDKPFFPRIIEHQGESPAFLAQLGFNAIRIVGVPSAELLRDANAAKIWIIGEPAWQQGPQGLTLPEFTADWDAVLMWNLGDRLDDRALPAVTSQAKALRLLDRRGRPTVCAPETNLREFSRQADVLSFSRWALGTSLELADYEKALQARSLLGRPGTPFWTMVPTQPATGVREQWQALTGRDWSTAAHEPDAIRLQVWQALGAGVRGIEFGSHSRLDINDAATRQRADGLSLLNHELALIEPWIAAGTPATVVGSTHKHIRGSILEFERSKLLIASRMATGSQQVPEHGLDEVGFVVPGVPESYDVLELTSIGLKRLRTRRVTGGVSFVLERCDDTAMVVLTPDAKTVDALTRRLSESAAQTAETARRFANTQYEIVERMTRELPILNQDVKVIAENLQLAKKALDDAERLSQAADRAGVLQATRTAVAHVGIIRRGAWEKAAKSLNSLVASPFSTTAATLPIHWLWLDGLRATLPMENRLPRGDMESLEAMAAAGWRHGQSPQTDLRAILEIERQIESPTLGALRMRIGTATPSPGPNGKKASKDAGVQLLETPPLWITTPTIPVRAGEWICIRGRINIPAPIGGSVDGVMIFDSHAGETLAERIGVTKGWEDFVLYRIATKNEPLTVTIALTGYGEVLLDDVTVRAMARPTPGMNDPIAAPQPGPAEPPRFQIVPPNPARRPDAVNGINPQPMASGTTLNLR